MEDIDYIIDKLSYAYDTRKFPVPKNRKLHPLDMADVIIERTYDGTAVVWLDAVNKTVIVSRVYPGTDPDDGYAPDVRFKSAVMEYSGAVVLNADGRVLFKRDCEVYHVVPRSLLGEGEYHDEDHWDDIEEEFYAEWDDIETIVDDDFVDVHSVRDAVRFLFDDVMGVYNYLDEYMPDNDDDY